MPTYNGGSASIRIRPNADDFIRDLRRQLDRHRDPGFEVNITADTTPALQEIQRLRQSVDGSNLSVNIDLDMTAARARIAEFRQVEESDPIVIPVDVDTTRALMSMLAFRQMQESNSFNVYADVNTTTASSEMARWRREQEALGIDIRVNANTRGLGLGGGGGGGLRMAATAIAALSQAPMAAYGVAQLAAALQQLAGAGLAVPGILGGVVASVGTLVTGLSGIKDAYDAVSEAAESSGTDQAAQARAAATATKSLRNAVVDEAQAQKDVARARRDARQQLADLNIELRGGKISEARALLELQRAQQELASGDYTDQADAILRVAETEQNLLEVRARNADLQQDANDANAAGIEGSDGVVAANERLVRSQQQVADAQAAVSDATTQTSTNAEAAAAAMDRLTPSAQKIVEVLIGQKGAFSQLGDSVQETMTEGLAGQLENTLDSLMPTLDKGLTGIADGWNQTFEQLFTSVGDPENQGLLDRLLGNTAEAQSRFADAVDPIVDAVLTLAGAGSDSLPRIADAIGDIATRFADFLAEADADGRLQNWIDEGLDGMANLGNAALNIMDAIDGITNAVDGDFLQALETGTGKLADFLNSTDGQNKLREFFDHGEEMLNAWKPILEALPGIFSGAMQGSGAAVQTFLGILSGPLELLSEFPELVGAAAAAFITVLAASAVRTAIMSLVGWIGTIRTALTATAATTGLIGALQAVATGPLGLIAVAGAAAATFLAFNDHVDSSIEKTKRLQEAQEDLETTLDRITGKITAQTRGSLIDTARSFQSAAPGGPSGDVIEAGQALGVDPYQLISAGLGDTAAQDAINQVLVGNNLAPEFSANPELGFVQRTLEAHGVSADTLYAALLGDEQAIAAVSGVLTSTEGDAAFTAGQQSGQISRAINNLGDIATMLSASGRNSVLVGNFIRQQAGLLPGAQSDAQVNNQAQFGVHGLTPYGQDVFGPGAMVQFDGSNYIVTSDTLDPALVPTLRDRGHTVDEPTPPSTTYQIIVAPDRVQDLVAYDRGGPTPSGRGPGPTGGWLAEVHDDEWVISKRGRAKLPDAFWDAANRGMINPKDLAGLGLPGFEQGGPVDEENRHGPWLGPNTPASPGPLPGPAAPGPVAPNPTLNQSGGILGAVNTAINGLQTPLNNGMNFLNGVTPTTGVVPTMTSNPLSSWFPWLPQPGQDLSAWNPFANAPDKIQPQNLAAEFGNILLTGVLSFFGLENSILSPNNTYRQAIDQTAGFYMNRLGTGQTSMTGLNLPTSLQIPGAPTGQLITDQMIANLYTDPNAAATVARLVNPSSAAVNAQIGYGLPAGTSISYGSEGFPDWVYQVAEAFGLQASTYSGHQEGSGMNRGIDWSGPVANMQRFAEYVSSVPGMEQVIWMNPGTGQMIGVDPGDRGADQTIENYYRDDWADHTDHVHTRQSGPIPVPTFDSGGWLQPGLSLALNKTGRPEPILTHEQGKAVQQIAQSVVQPAPAPPPRIPDAIQIQPPAPVPQPSVPQVPSPTPTPAPVTPIPSTPAVPTPQPVPVTAPQPTAAPPSSIDHNLGWIDQGIMSGASALGNLAASAASMGMAAGGAGGGGGLASSMISGLFTQGGKIVKDAVNVVSSFLVGSVPGSMGEPGAPVYGKTLRPDQFRPDTAEARPYGGGGYRPTFNAYGFDFPTVRRELNFQEQMDMQAGLAHRPA